MRSGSTSTVDLATRSRWLRAGSSALAGLLALLVATAANALSYVGLDYALLGADDATIASASGQTFTDIGTTLGIPQLVGVDLTLRSEFSPGGAAEFPSDQDVYWRSVIPADGFVRVTYSFSTSLAVRMVGGSYLGDGEGYLFGPAAAGGITAPTAEPGVTILDDFVQNDLDGGGTIVLSEGFIFWEGTGATFTLENFVDTGSTASAANGLQVLVPEPGATVLLLLAGAGLAASAPIREGRLSSRRRSQR